MRQVEYDAAATLLHQFSEWLDGEGLIAEPTEDDDRSHDDFVKAFLDQRTETWLPEVVPTGHLGPQFGGEAVPGAYQFPTRTYSTEGFPSPAMDPACMYQPGQMPGNEKEGQ